MCEGLGEVFSEKIHELAIDWVQFCPEKGSHYGKWESNINRNLTLEEGISHKPDYKHA